MALVVLSFATDALIKLDISFYIYSTLWSPDGSKLLVSSGNESEHVLVDFS